jgi:hypothetical protein
MVDLTSEPRLSSAVLAYGAWPYHFSPDGHFRWRLYGKTSQ